MGFAMAQPNPKGLLAQRRKGEVALGEVALPFLCPKKGETR
jgi:hypothetical protein